jgi:hypothetical protein
MPCTNNLWTSTTCCPGRRPTSSSAASTSAAAAEASTSTSTSSSRPTWDIRMLYDGECALCMKEVNFLRKRDANKGRIDFVDVASTSYRAEDNAGITFAQVSSSCHMR